MIVTKYMHQGKRCEAKLQRVEFDADKQRWTCMAVWRGPGVFHRVEVTAEQLEQLPAAAMDALRRKAEE